MRSGLIFSEKFLDAAASCNGKFNDPEKLAAYVIGRYYCFAIPGAIWGAMRGKVKTYHGQ